MDKQKVGLTTTIPVEILFASNHLPIDVNNLFVTADYPEKCIEYAEQIGYPRTSCSWIKGLYGAMLEHKLQKVIAVMVGDCSYTHSLMETLKLQGVEALSFAYPYDRDRQALRHEIEKLMEVLGTTYEQVNIVKARLDQIRRKLVELDRLTWQDNKVTGFENHLWQVSSSDFNGDYQQFELQLDELLAEVNSRKPFQQKLRLGYIGVPPILTNLYQYVENKGAYVVYNEVQRQFTMPYFVDDIVEQYALYTYPYDVNFRLQDIQQEIKNRKLDGIIHYTQSFCHRQIDDIVFKKYIDIPILTLEADRPGILDARTRMRLDAFIDMLLDSRNTNEEMYINSHVEISNNVQNNKVHENSKRLLCGIDLGSRNVKMAILSEDGIEDLRSFNTIDFYRDYGRKVGDVFQIDFDKLNIEGVDTITSTGYGRNTIKLANAYQIAELEAHLLGALYQVDIDDFTLLDLGGQDSKVIMVRNRKMLDFITNDKCAASSGRFLENMATVIGVPLDELAKYYDNPVELNATCAVFGESELIGRIAEGVSKEELSAGINYTIVKRIEPLLLKLYSDTVVFTGGVANNHAVVKQLQSRITSKIIIPKHPEYNGAIGAAVKYY
jgi:predicted CoA-substrate-specific enzyme activase